MHHRFIDQYSGLDSFLHRLDPRSKIIAFMAIVIFILSVPAGNFALLYFYGLLVVALILLSNVPISFIFLRSLAVLPFVGLAAFSLFFQLTTERIYLFYTVLLKAYEVILCMIVLVSTTLFADLLKAMEKMRCPALFIMVLSFLYRYVYLFIDEFMHMNLAFACRTVRKRAGRLFQWKVFSNMIANLLVRSYEKGEGVYLAMCSRGYQGKIETLNRFSLNRTDVLFMAAVLAYLLFLRILCLMPLK